MKYVKNNKIYHLNEVRELLPNVSISDGCELVEFGYETLIETPTPFKDGFHYIESLDGLNQVWIEVANEVVVPQTISPRQARLALLQATLLDEVELLLVNDKAMQIWWEYSLDIQRNHEHIIAMGAALGLSESQLDDLFILAGSL